MNIYLEDPRYLEALKDYPDLTLTDKKDATCVITGRYTEKDYHDAHQVVFIPFTGHNGIDIDLLKAKGLKLFNTSAHSVFVAERALALTLALLGKIPSMHEKLRGGDWSNRFNEERIPWVTIQNKTVGIYGYGAIGRAFHNYVRPLAKNIVTIDRQKDYQDAELVPDLERLADVSDILVVAAPLTQSTRHTVNATVLSKLNGYLINVGRGPIVEETALYESLLSGETKGFASDVWYHYPKDATLTSPTTTPLETLDNVVMSPHVAGFTDRSTQMMIDDVFNTILNIAKGDLSRALNLDQLDNAPFRK